MTDEPEPTILDGAFIVTKHGIRATRPCAICGRPISEMSLVTICTPCWDYYGTSANDVLTHCRETGTLRPRR
jgi:ribosome-binding protein aMBF1 (putative translation factor)